MAIGVDEKFIVLAMENKQNAHFAFVSNGAMDELATRYIRPRKQTTRWSVTAFQDWRDTHNAQPVNVKCTNNLLVECEAGALNKWLAGFVAEAM